jgi:hypothetical protein
MRAATITDQSGATIGTFTSTVSADNNFDASTGASATAISVSGTGNLDITNATSKLTTDTLTFEGQSAAGMFSSGQTDGYGRTYARAQRFASSVQSSMRDRRCRTSSRRRLRMIRYALQGSHRFHEP